MSEANTTVGKNFNIPKIKRQESKDNLRTVTLDSRDAKELVSAIEHSYLDPGYRGTWKLKSLQLVENKDLEENYRKKKQDLKDEGRHLRDLVDHYAFLLFRDANIIGKIAKNGLLARSLPFNSLGNSKLGLYVCRNADVQFRLADSWNIPFCVLVVFKVILGRCKSLLLHPFTETSETVEPTPNFDCHVSQLIAKPNDSISNQLAKSQIFLYEYNEDCVPSKSPRQCLPYAILTYEKKGGIETSVEGQSYVRVNSTSKPGYTGTRTVKNGFPTETSERGITRAGQVRNVSVGIQPPSSEGSYPPRGLYSTQEITVSPVDPRLELRRPSGEKHPFGHPPFTQSPFQHDQSESPVQQQAPPHLMESTGVSRDPRLSKDPRVRTKEMNNADYYSLSSASGYISNPGKLKTNDYFSVPNSDPYLSHGLGYDTLIHGGFPHVGGEPYSSHAYMHPVITEQWSSHSSYQFQQHYGPSSSVNFSSVSVDGNKTSDSYPNMGVTMETKSSNTDIKEDKSQGKRRISLEEYKAVSRKRSEGSREDMDQFKEVSLNNSFQESTDIGKSLSCKPSTTALNNVENTPAIPNRTRVKLDVTSPTRYLYSVEELNKTSSKRDGYVEITSPTRYLQNLEEISKKIRDLENSLGTGFEDLDPLSSQDMSLILNSDLMESAMEESALIKSPSKVDVLEFPVQPDSLTTQLKVSGVSQDVVQSHVVALPHTDNTLVCDMDISQSEDETESPQKLDSIDLDQRTTPVDCLADRHNHWKNLNVEPSAVSESKPSASVENQYETFSTLINIEKKQSQIVTTTYQQSTLGTSIDHSLSSQTNISIAGSLSNGTKTELIMLPSSKLSSLNLRKTDDSSAYSFCTESKFLGSENNGERKTNIKPLDPSLLKRIADSYKISSTAVTNSAVTDLSEQSDYFPRKSHSYTLADYDVMNSLTSKDEESKSDTQLFDAYNMNIREKSEEKEMKSASLQLKDPNITGEHLEDMDLRKPSASFGSRNIFGDIDLRCQNELGDVDFRQLHTPPKKGTVYCSLDTTNRQEKNWFAGQIESHHGRIEQGHPDNMENYESCRQKSRYQLYNKNESEYNLYLQNQSTSMKSKYNSDTLSEYKHKVELDTENASHKLKCYNWSKNTKIPGLNSSDEKSEFEMEGNQESNPSAPNITNVHQILKCVKFDLPNIKEILANVQMLPPESKNFEINMEQNESEDSKLTECQENGMKDLKKEPSGDHIPFCGASIFSDNTNGREIIPIKKDIQNDLKKRQETDTDIKPVTGACVQKETDRDIKPVTGTCVQKKRQETDTDIKPVTGTCVQKKRQETDTDIKPVTGTCVQKENYNKSSANSTILQSFAEHPDFDYIQPTAHMSTTILKTDALSESILCKLEPNQSKVQNYQLEENESSIPPEWEENSVMHMQSKELKQASDLDTSYVSSEVLLDTDEESSLRQVVPGLDLLFKSKQDSLKEKQNKTITNKFGSMKECKEQANDTPMMSMNFTGSQGSSDCKPLTSVDCSSVVDRSVHDFQLLPSHGDEITNHEKKTQKKSKKINKDMMGYRTRKRRRKKRAPYGTDIKSETSSIVSSLGDEDIEEDSAMEDESVSKFSDKILKKVTQQGTISYSKGLTLKDLGVQNWSECLLDPRFQPKVVLRSTHLKDMTGPTTQVPSSEDGEDYYNEDTDLQEEIKNADVELRVETGMGKNNETKDQASDQEHQREVKKLNVDEMTSMPVDKINEVKTQINKARKNIVIKILKKSSVGIKSDAKKDPESDEKSKASVISNSCPISVILGSSATLPSSSIFTQTKQIPTIEGGAIVSSAKGSAIPSLASIPRTITWTSSMEETASTFGDNTAQNHGNTDIGLMHTSPPFPPVSGGSRQVFPPYMPPVSLPGNNLPMQALRGAMTHAALTHFQSPQRFPPVPLHQSAMYFQRPEVLSGAPHTHLHRPNHCGPPPLSIPPISQPQIMSRGPPLVHDVNIRLPPPGYVVPPPQRGLSSIRAQRILQCSPSVLSGGFQQSSIVTNNIQSAEINSSVAGNKGQVYMSQMVGTNIPPGIPMHAFGSETNVQTNLPEGLLCFGNPQQSMPLGSNRPDTATVNCQKSVGIPNYNIGRGNHGKGHQSTALINIPLESSSPISALDKTKLDGKAFQAKSSGTPVKMIESQDKVGKPLQILSEHLIGKPIQAIGVKSLEKTGQVHTPETQIQTYSTVLDSGSFGSKDVKLENSDSPAKEHLITQLDPQKEKQDLSSRLHPLDKLEIESEQCIKEHPLDVLNSKSSKSVDKNSKHPLDTLDPKIKSRSDNKGKEHPLDQLTKNEVRHVSYDRKKSADVIEWFAEKFTPSKKRPTDKESHSSEESENESSHHSFSGNHKRQSVADFNGLERKKKRDLFFSSFTNAFKTKEGNNELDQESITSLAEKKNELMRELANLGTDSSGPSELEDKSESPGSQADRNVRNCIKRTYSDTESDTDLEEGEVLDNTDRRIVHVRGDGAKISHTKRSTAKSMKISVDGHENVSYRMKSISVVQQNTNSSVHEQSRLGWSSHVKEVATDWSSMLMAPEEHLEVVKGKNSNRVVKDSGEYSRYLNSRTKPRTHYDQSPVIDIYKSHSENKSVIHTADVNTYAASSVDVTINNSNSKLPISHKELSNEDSVLSKSAELISKKREKIIASSQVKTLEEWLQVEFDLDNVQHLAKFIPFPLDTSFPDISKVKRRKLKQRVRAILESKGNKVIKSVSCSQVQINSPGMQIQSHSLFSRPEVSGSQIQKELKIVKKALDDIRNSRESTLKSVNSVNSWQHPHTLKTGESLQLQSALVVVELDMKNMLQRTCFYGYPHRKIPSEVLLDSEKSSFKSEDEVFLILMTPVSSKSFSKLVSLKHKIESMLRLKANPVNSSMERQKSILADIKKLHNQRQNIMRPFTGYLNKKRQQKLEEQLEKYQLVHDYLKKQSNPVPDSLLKYLKTTVDDIKDHLTMVKQYQVLEDSSRKETTETTKTEITVTFGASEFFPPS